MNLNVDNIMKLKTAQMLTKSIVGRQCPVVWHLILVSPFETLVKQPTMNWGYFTVSLGDFGIRQIKMGHMHSFKNNFYSYFSGLIYDYMVVKNNSCFFFANPRIDIF